MRLVGRRGGGRRRALLVVVAAVATVAACDAGGVASAVVPATPTTPVVVTFEVGGDERFRALLTGPDAVATARRLLAGEDVPSIPDGRVVRETGVNTGWSWSLDPADTSLTDVTNEACDGLPSEVEDGSIAGDRYCPWSAVVIAVDPAP